MAPHLAHASSVILALAGPAAKMRGVGPADPMQDFGSLWTLAVGLNVINTVIVLYYLVRIWMQKERPAA
ncbi:MAG TPA: hypothetical protein VEZ44_03385 [bacterium]|nr:hypothetical protein [bacterium]